MSSNNDDDGSDFFDSELFLNLNYQLKPFEFGPLKFNLKILDSACTDYDLTGQVIWPASYALAYYLLEQKANLQHDEILEVGSGTGITGIVAAMCSKKVIVTDYNDVVLDLLDHNAKFNSIAGSQCICKKLDWTIPESRLTFEAHSFDVIIGSDVVYWYNMIVPLLETVDYLLSDSPNAKFILAFKHRAANTEAWLFQQAQDTFHFQIEDVPVSSFVPESELEKMDGIYLKIFTRKPKGC